MEKTLFLLDGHALVYRAHYAFMSRPLINSKGMNTSAVNGFVRSLWEMLQKQKPSHLAVAFDLPTPTFRHAMYEPYKANRDAQPEDITAAFPYIEEIIRAMQIPVITCDGYEADDVIGTLAKQAEKEDFKVFMVTPDKDYGQLVSDRIFMYKPARMGNDVEIWGIKEVCDNWQIQRPEQVIDILSLQGDAVDNIPGIPSIGPKTAAVLLAKYDNLENIIAHAHELKGKQREQIENFAEQGRLSRRLAIIDINVPVVFDAEQYAVSAPDKSRLSAVFKELEIRSLADAILGKSEKPKVGQQTDLFGEAMPSESAEAAPKSAEPPAEHAIATKNIDNTEHRYHLTDTPAARAALIELLAAQTEFCFDTETTGVDANAAELVGMSFAVQPFEAYYVPIPAEPAAAHKIVSEFKEVLENQAIAKIGQNIKYDAILLKWYGIEVGGDYFDTMLAHYLLEPELRHNMNYLSETYLSYAPVSIESLIGKKGKNQGSMRDVAVEKASDYAAEDADVTIQLKDILFSKVKAEGFEPLYTTMEAPLVRVLTDLEYEGINLNVDFLARYSVELDKKIKILEQNIYIGAGTHFNISSPKQVGEILFDRLRLPYRFKKTKTGQYSTDEEVLSELATTSELVRNILSHRGVIKLKSTYVDALPPLINTKTGRLHSSFNQALTATGRLSSNNPNLQNIPIKTPEGSEVRKAFIPRNADHVLVSADYSQIELRLIAEISGDAAMLAAFQSGHDIHRATAAGVYQVPLDLVSADQRRNAKTVNFSIIYGAGAQNLSQQLSISRTEAKHLIEQYFVQYQGLKHYMDATVEFARTNGYVMTLLGRRRWLRDINSRNSLARSNSERIAINTPIQGTAADMIKLAMINIHKALKDNNLQTKMILQVHDELVFDVPKNELDLVKPLIKEKMENAIPNLKVPILVEVGVGDNWLEAH